MSDFGIADPADSLPVQYCTVFTGSRQQMQACVDRGLYIGITGGVCDERRGLLSYVNSYRLFQRKATLI